MLGEKKEESLNAKQCHHWQKPSQLLPLLKSIQGYDQRDRKLKLELLL